MANEIEHPFSLNFQVDSLHSGSISFGKFETEDLCWERRSSFSHNRYLEEVEKCSKPGSVTEKKAYFEAHFRKKGFPYLNSPQCQNRNECHAIENNVSEKMASDIEVHCVNNPSRFDEDEDFVISFSELEADTIPEQVKVMEADDVDLGSLLSANSNFGTKMNDNFDGETADLDANHTSTVAVDLIPESANEESTDPCPKEQKASSPEVSASSEAECVVPKLIPGVQAEQRRWCTSGISTKASETKSHKTAPVLSKAEKSLEAHKRHAMLRTSKYEHGSKTKSVLEFNSARRELSNSNQIIKKPPSSTPRKIFNRAQQSATRVSSAIDANNSSIRQHNYSSVVKSNGSMPRRKEFDMNSEGRTRASEAKVHQLHKINQKNAEIEQFKKSLNIIPSFHCGTTGNGYRNEIRDSTNEPPKLRSKYSSPGVLLSSKSSVRQNISRGASTRTRDPPQASVTSRHSTVTSDSCVGTSNRHASLAIGSKVSKKKLEKEKQSSLLENKVHDANRMYKGKPFGGFQKTGAVKGSYPSSNSSSRASHVAS